MPRALPPDVRQQILAQRQLGLSAADLARRLGLSERTVRHLVQHRPPGTDGPPLATAYDRCGRTYSNQQQQRRQQCLTLRQEHPGWGAARLRLALRQLDPHAPLPGRRTLQRWLEHEGLSPPRVRRPCRPETDRRADAVHQVWQMDAAEHMVLAGGDQASWLRVVDEYSGAVLSTVVFPPGQLAQRAGPVRAGSAADDVRTLGATAAVARR
jgi:hypothetical protein